MPNLFDQVGNLPRHNFVTQLVYMNRVHVNLLAPAVKYIKQAVYRNPVAVT